MKIEDYTPYVSALAIPDDLNHTNTVRLSNVKLNYLADLLDLAPSKYVLSMSNPRCTIPKAVSKEIGHGIYSRKDDLIRYYLPNAIIVIGKDGIDDICKVLIVNVDELSKMLIQYTPAFASYLISDMKFTLNEMFSANGLNHHLSID